MEAKDQGILSVAWMFPGQGSQRARMAADLSEAADLFRIAREVLGDDLKAISTEDPKPTWAPERLQPALLITCTAAARALSSRGLSPAGVVGHSLGEFAALVTAESINLEDALKLVSLRARAMSRAAQQNPGGMAAVIGLPSASVQEICAEVTHVWTANLNSPTQTVISGTDQALSRAAEQCIRAGAPKVIRLEVPIPSHCPLMASAADELERALEGVEVREPICDFYSCADALPHREPAEIRRLLVRGLISPVRFVEAINRMASDGVAAMVEVGPGSVLRGLVRQADAQVQLWAVRSDEDAEKVADEAGALAAS